jgi:hypothetical protein
LPPPFFFSLTAKAAFLAVKLHDQILPPALPRVLGGSGVWQR